MIKKAEEHLKKSDKVLGVVVRGVGPCIFTPSNQGPFHVLVSSIIGQQLSAKAAHTIRNRVVNLLRQEGPFHPEDLLSLSPESLREAGLSAAKVKYVLGLASAVSEGKLDLLALGRQDDETVIQRLTQQAGIGRWTAEMFLIFAYGRPDILSLADSGLRRAVQELYGFNGRPSDNDMIRLGEKWRPFRTVASWYLWRSLE